MRTSCILCIGILIALGVFASVYAFTGFNLLLFICFKNYAVYRSFLAVSGVAALYSLFALIAFKPFKGLR